MQKSNDRVLPNTSASRALADAELATCRGGTTGVGSVPDIDAGVKAAASLVIEQDRFSAFFHS